jgi:hypothetical protein
MSTVQKPNLAYVDWNWVRETLEKCWSPETAYRKKDYTPELPSRGQCYVTAMLIKKYYDGEVYNGKLKKNDESHYWNGIYIHNTYEGGYIRGIDLTSDQYGGDGYTPLPELEFYRIIRKRKLNYTNKRFLLLEEKWNEFYSKLIRTV